MGVLSNTKPGADSFRITASGTGINSPDIAELERRIHQKLLEEVEAEEISHLNRAQMANEIQVVTDNLLAQEGLALPIRARESIVGNIIDEILGYGPIQPLLEDEDISEVMVNSPKRVYAEKKRKTLSDR